MTYDESIARAEAIIAQLENAEALSMEEYKRLSSEATKLLRSCKEEIMRIKCYFITDKGEKIVFYLYISKFCCTFAADFD